MLVGIAVRAIGWPVITVTLHALINLTVWFADVSNIHLRNDVTLTTTGTIRAVDMTAGYAAVPYSNLPIPDPTGMVQLHGFGAAIVCMP
jgi:hypothetical protein